tara:strand:- start:16 stop:147 length:132 start_codon:yes stop_codon:yes gene_type:complete
MKRMYKPKDVNKKKMETFISKLESGEFNDKININYINLGKKKE